MGLEGLVSEQKTGRIARPVAALGEVEEPQASGVQPCAGSVLAPLAA